jgi:uncharacterized protein (TIGR04255 family)
MTAENLKNKPLVEAILEVRWNISNDPVKFPLGFDPNNTLLLGRFSERAEKDYPVRELLPNSQVPDIMVPFMVQHRFRKSPNGWPLVQIGPGIMTVNETAGYTWATFKPLCENAVKYLFEAYPDKNSFKAQDVVLRYIDAVDVDFEKENIFSFLEKKMKTTISLPENLFAGTDIEANPRGFNWQVSFFYKKVGNITVQFGMGVSNNKPSLIWETLVQSTPNILLAVPSDFSVWLENAHNVTHDLFFKLIDGELKERFSK